MTRDTFEMKPMGERGEVKRGSSQEKLRKALKSNDFDTFEKLIMSQNANHGAVNLEHVYQYPDYKTCLEIAVSEPNKHDFVKLLLQHGVEVNRINEDSKAPIHIAVENGNIDALKALLKDPRIKVDIQWKGNTALLLAIKNIDEKLKKEKSIDDLKRVLATYEDMVELLLKAGCNVNTPDMKGITPVHSAAKQSLEKIIILISNHAKKPIYLKRYEDYTGKTAHDCLKEVFPHLLTKFNTEVTETIIDNDKLFYYLSRNEEDNFIRDFKEFEKKKDVFEANNGMYTILQFATAKELDRVVETLLFYNANPNYTYDGNKSTPIEIACKYGYHKILKMFMENENTSFDPENGESLILVTVKGMQSNSKITKVAKANFDACLKLLLSNPKINITINFSDEKGNTALHYAARNDDHETILELLRNGACLDLRNKFNEPPLADINAKTFETYLDECIKTNDKWPSDDNYEIHMKYSCLVHSNKLCKVPSMENVSSKVKVLDSLLVPETDVLLYMTRNEYLRPLLKHPVIASFLYLKWKRISFLFRANFAIYLLFWLCLILYIIFGYGVKTKQSGWVETFNVITYAGVVIGLILLFFRELFQLLLSPARYLKGFENLMEIILIFFTIWIVCYDSAGESNKQVVSSAAILISSAEMVVLISQFSTLSTYFIMLKTVSCNFLKFLLWYCVFIIAFALSFYTLFRQEDEDKIPLNLNITGTEDVTDKKKEEDFFKDPGRSLFKTIIMLTGEFEAGSIKFSTFPVTSHIIFIVFVFMIPIVLFNLLNGLAVGDTQEIRADAELVGHIYRVELISYFESILIGNSRSYSRSSNSRSWLPSCFGNFRKSFSIQYNTFLRRGLKNVFITFAKRINLFPNLLPKYMIILKPNQDNKIEIPEPLTIEDNYEDRRKRRTRDVESGGACCFKRYQNYELGDRQIVKNIKNVVKNKTNVTEFDKINDRLSTYEIKIESLESTMNEAIRMLQALKSYHD